MFKNLTVQRHERYALLLDGQFVRLYTPGRWLVFTGLSLVEWARFDITSPVSRLGLAEVVPDDLDGAHVIDVAHHQRAVVTVNGEFHEVLDPGRYRVWSDAGDVEVVVVDAFAEPVALAESDRLQADGAFMEATVSDDRAVVLCRDGVPERLLPRGRYRAWAGGPWQLRVVSLALHPLEVAAQDLVTLDQVPVRVKPGVSYRIGDALTCARESRATEIAYAAVQLALREVVAARTLDQLVSERQDLSTELLEVARGHLPDVGIALERVFVKDLILSGEIKDLVNRVTLARKEAEADAIRRRQEVAATRQLANTAKLLEQNPVLFRLKELEAMGALAERIDKLVVVGGADLARDVLRTQLES